MRRSNDTPDNGLTDIDRPTDVLFILLGFSRPRPNGFLTKGALKRISGFVLKITFFAHSVPTGQRDWFQP